MNESIMQDTVPRAIGKSAYLEPNLKGLQVSSQVRTVVRNRNQLVKGMLNNENTCTSNALESNLQHLDGAHEDDASGLDDLFMRQGPQVGDKIVDNMSLASRAHEKPTHMKTTVMTSK